MRLRPLLPAALLALVITSGSASAATWHAFSSKSLGFAMRYPAGWKATSVAEPAGEQIQFSHQGSTNYTLNVTILKLNGGTSTRVLKQRFLAFEKRIGNPVMAEVHWGAVTLGGRHGIGGVYIPATEGGVSVSNGSYVISWKSRTYVLNLLSVQKPAAKSLGQFPKIYKQILATWRFR